MRLVVALGGNALLARRELPDAEVQEGHVRVAVHALAPLARAHQLVVTHGNGPQVGLLANESAADPALRHAYPLDVLGAQTQGMIGYWLLQELEAAAPGRPVAALVTQTEVDPGDPAFGAPAKFVGPLYDEPAARRMAAEHGWAIRQDDGGWRRVVASPEPRRVVELGLVGALLDVGAVVVCAGGGGVPVTRRPDGRLAGVEAVVDKDLTSALVATELDADALVVLTDVPAVEVRHGTPHAQALGRVTVAELRAAAPEFPAGSMGPKVEAACRFVAATGRRAAIGRLEDAAGLVEGRAGTVVVPD